MASDLLDMASNRRRIAPHGFPDLACAFAVVLVLDAPAGARLVPVGPEFLVNEYTTSAQREPDVAADGAGGFVVAWESFPSDDEDTGIRARRFDSAGAAVGGEFRVNAYTTGYQSHPRVAAGASGFVVVWGGYGPPPNPLTARRFDTTGSPQGTDFQVNTYSTHVQYQPAVGAHPSGAFVVTWTSYDLDGDATGVFAQRFDSAGGALGGAFRVNSYTTGSQGGADVGVDAAGDFVAVWGSQGQDGAGGGVFAQRFDSAGGVAGTEFQVNGYTTGAQGSPAVAVAPDGNFAVVWTSLGGQDGDGSGVFGRRYDAGGAPIGGEFPVNDYTTSNQSRPAVAAESGGGFVVTWQSLGQDGSGYGIFARRFDPNGVAESEFRVNTYVTSYQVLPRIARTAAHEYAVVWDSTGQDGSFRGVFGRRIADLSTTLAGRRLAIRTPPGHPARNRLALLSRDPNAVAPATAGDDPRCAPLGSGSLVAGGRLRVLGSGGDLVIDLPCTGWSANAARTRYRYRDTSGTTCQRVEIIAGRAVIAICRGAQLAYSLGVTQENVSVVLSTADPATREYCFTFGPGTGTTIRKDGANGVEYRAINAGEGSCP